MTTPAEFDAWVETVRDASDTLIYPEGYEALAEPSESHPVEYFSAISPALYESILTSFHTGGEHDMGDDHAMGSDHADASDGDNDHATPQAAASGHHTDNHATQDHAMRTHPTSVEAGG